MPTFDSGRAASIGGLNIRNRRGSDLTGIRFADNRSAAPTSANDMVLYRVSNSLRFWDGTTEYNLLTSVSGSVGDLNGVYENGRAVTVDEGPIILTDATTGALDTMRITTSGAKSGDALEFLFTGASTGRGIHLDMDQAITAVGILIDSGGDARTGADIQFTDDSTGTHICLDINSSGSGASTGLAWTDSFNGTDAAFGIQLTLDAEDGTDATALQIVRNASGTARSVPAIDIDEASTGTANCIDIDVSGVYVGDIISVVTSAAATGNIIFIDLDSALAGTALHMEGSGTRTQPFVELISDCVGSAVYVDVNITGASSGNVIDITGATTSTGTFVDLNMGSAVGAEALNINGGNGARTANLVGATHDGSGNADFMEVTNSNTGSGHVFDINVTGAGSGQVLDVVVGSAAYTGDVISIDLGATATGSQAIVLTSGVMTRSTVLVDINENGAASGNTIDVDIGAVTYTGNVLDINLGATATGGQALVVASGAMNRTVSLIEIGDAGTSSGVLLDINITGAVTGNIVDIVTSAAATGNVINIDLDAGVAATAARIDSGAGLRTQPVVEFIMEGTGTGAGGTLMDINVNQSGASSNPLIDIDLATGAYAGNIFDVGVGAAATGNVINIDLDAGVAATAVRVDSGAGTRTQPVVEFIMEGNGTGAGGTLMDINVNSSGATSNPLIDIDIATGIYAGNIIDIVYSVAASTGDTLHIDMATNVAGSAIVIDTAGSRTDDLIKIDDTSAGNSHIFDINLTGIYTGNVLDITFATAAATGEAISLAMGTNVAGRALFIDSSGTGATDEGSAIDIDHDGVLIADADVVRIAVTGAISSTSNALAISTIGDEGSNALYINATGSAEAIHVDAGAVVFDETLLVTGVATFTAKPVLPILTELNTTIDTRSTAAAINSTATATAAEVATGRITSTSGAATTITLPTGTLLGGELSASAGDVFDLVIDNTAGSSTVTIAVAVNGVLSTAAVDTGGSFGDLTVASGVTGVAVYRIMFTSATAYAFTRVA
jgi:hypothetical protein